MSREHLNPPLEEPEADPDQDVDLGYLEDREGERDVEEERAPVRQAGGDPLELDREKSGEPGELDEYDAEELREIPPRERGELAADTEDAGDPDDPDR